MSLKARAPTGVLVPAFGTCATVETYTLHPTPYTLHPTPYTLHPEPYALNPEPGRAPCLITLKPRVE